MLGKIGRRATSVKPFFREHWFDKPGLLFAVHWDSPSQRENDGGKEAMGWRVFFVYAPPVHIKTLSREASEAWSF